MSAQQMTHAPRRAQALIADMRDACIGFIRAWRRPDPTRPATRWPRFLTTSLVVAFAVVALAYAGDRAGLAWARTLPQPLVAAFALITLLGASGWLVAATLGTCLAAFAMARRAQDRTVATGLRLLSQRAFYVFTVLMASGLASQVLKHFLGRARPRLVDEFGPFHFDFLSVKATLASMPSGHATSAFAVAAALAFFLPRARLVFFGMALLVAVSRVAIGAHYISDVCAGTFVGIASAYLVANAFAARRLVFTRNGGGLHVRGRWLCAVAVRTWFSGLARR